MPVLETAPEATRGISDDERSYGQILKSSAMIGGSSLVNIAIGIIRTKAIAIMLGPTGFGLFGLYNSIVDLAQGIAGMGVNSSGVRQIAEAAGSNDAERISRTAVILRRTSILLGVIGALLLFVSSTQVSTLTFGSDRHAAAVSLLSIAVFLRLVSAGQGALINGMRRIADLAKMNVLSALFGAVISIVVVYFLREDGIVPSLILIAAAAILTSWWYSRKIQIQTPRLTASETGQEAAALLKLGFAFMASSLMMLGSAYIVRVTILRKLGVESAGLYQSAWTLGGLYVGFILQAMGADFYPRLTAIVKDNEASNRMVNEQARVGLLLAGPGVVATLTFAPLVIAMFYSAEFAPAVEVLRWICLGATLRVITWPMGYIILAKGSQRLFLLSEIAWTCVLLGLTWICVNFFGLNGTGMAFFGSYIFHGCLIYSVVSRLSGFRWSVENKQTGLFFLLLISVAFCGFHAFPLLIAIGVGTLALVIAGVYSIRVLLKITYYGGLPPSMRRLLAVFGFTSQI